MLGEGDIYGAERILRQFLLKHGNPLEAILLLAQIGLQLDVLDNAEFLLESVLTFDPNYHIARYDYAVVLGKRHKHAAALEQARKLLSIDPRNRAFRTVYATACVGLGDHEEALRVYRELLAETPQNPELHLSIAHALKTQGQQAESIESYRAAAAARADFGDAYWSLANLKTYRFTDEELARMRQIEGADATKLVDRYHLCFALGKALEDRGEYEESFRYYERGNAFKKSESRFDLAPAERLRLGEKYIADTRVYRTDKPYFIDKMPNNFRHIGLIHLILPNARIIDARREPLACCFSNFKQLFASGQEFTYSLEDIGRYYRAYVDVTAHWDAVLPGRILRVQHESVVEDLEGNVRRLLDFLGLPFEAACIEFYRTERSVRTASSEQVRQPIYKEGIDQWRNFEPWLGPLKSALGDLLPG